MNLPKTCLAGRTGSLAAVARCGLGCVLAVATVVAGAATREPVLARHGMVVSAHGLASRAGVEILKDGGHAVDAAVATGLALAVVHPSAGNLGGGGFMLVFTSNGEVTAFDFREVAPQAAHERMYLGSDGQLVKDSNHEGYRAVGVPGTVAGFDLALQRFGRKSWQALAASAVMLAESGFPLSEAMAAEFRRRTNDWTRYPSSARVFLRPDGTPFAAGEVWRQPELGQTLKALQRGGRDEFYRGDIARQIAADHERHGGLITAIDLAGYRARERQPIHGTFRGLGVWSTPPPSSGGVALVEALNIIEGFDLRSAGHGSASHRHLLAEALRRAFADRAQHLGDPDFVADLPVARLVSKPYAEKMRRSIRPDRASASDPAHFNAAYESAETTHYSVVDAEGNAVVVTYTLEYSFGSRIVADGLGFLYNNEMGDFNPQPGRTDATGLIGTAPNLIAPGKRMLSSMTPTIVAKAGRPYLLVGSPGGRTIISTVTEIILNVVEFGMELPRAVTAGRIHHQWLPDELVAEPDAVSSDTQRALRGMGHTVRVGGLQGSVMAILVDPVSGLRLGVADPREPDGEAVGY